MTGKLWGGRFQGQQNDAFSRFNQSLGFDYRLLVQDIAGSRAYARAIGKAGILSDKEVEKLILALDEIESEYTSDERSLSEGITNAITEGIEDIHSMVEAALILRVGDLGKKLHTGRSRNDQVSTDFRLYIREESAKIVAKINELQLTLRKHGQKHRSAILPGYTHMQRAQPILWGHYLHSFVEMLERDKDRIVKASERMNTLPLGSGALAGNPWNVDRDGMAAELGFNRPMANSLDAVSARDFVSDFLYNGSQMMIHLSRLSEDLIIYASQEFQFVKMSDSVSTGSSLMPQKKNPDALELVRGKCGRTIGNLTGFLCTLKGLGSCYNKDLQEDKEVIFDTIETLNDCLDVTTTVIETLEINPKRMLEATKSGYLNATDLADYLVEKGVPFRDAHHLVGEIVNTCSQKGCSIEETPLENLKRFSPAIESDVFEYISIENCIARKTSFGGTGFSRVDEALQ
jgi:argininosuccinate lyase